ncbi:MAG: AIR synthase related protein, partial [Candidatus Bathyarchaeia archaeon]
MSKAKPHLTYAKSGVDIKKIKQSHKKIANMLRKTFSYRRGLTGEVSIEIGHYAGLLKLDKDKMLALHADGVGTKTLIATAMKKYDTIGIDCVAMNVNDLICIGAEPIAMVDYLAINKPEEDVIKDIMKGLAYGAKQARVSIVGGETAVMPDLINGFDLAAMSVGILNKDQLITGEKIEVGDKIYGLKSNGIHSNGLTLA